jgi:hypothetical protein
VAAAVRLDDVTIERVEPDVRGMGSVRPANGRPPFASTWPPR